MYIYIDLGSEQKHPDHTLRSWWTVAAAVTSFFTQPFCKAGPFRLQELTSCPKLLTEVSAKVSSLPASLAALPPLSTLPTVTGPLPLVWDVTVIQATKGNAAPGLRFAFSCPRSAAGSSSADTWGQRPLPATHQTLRKGTESGRAGPVRLARAARCPPAPNTNPARGPLFAGVSNTKSVKEEHRFSWRCLPGEN